MGKNIRKMNLLLLLILPTISLSCGEGLCISKACYPKQESKTKLPDFITHKISTSTRELKNFHPIDFDNDGDIDIVANGLSPHGMYLLKNNGTMNFEIVNLSTTTSSFFTVADVDSDNDYDIVFSSSNDFKWMENIAGDLNTIHTIHTSGGGARLVSTADFDGDNDMDITGYSQTDQKLWYLENDGSQNFTSSEITQGTPAIAILGLEAVDIDNDLDFDIVTSTIGGNNIQIFKNNGAANFTEETHGNKYLYKMEVLDYDQDNDLDLIGYNNGGHLLKNQGDGTFVQMSLGNVQTGTVQYSGVDLNSDGYTDIIASNDSFEYFLQQEDATFTSHHYNPMGTKTSYRANPTSMQFYSDPQEIFALRGNQILKFGKNDLENSVDYNLPTQRTSFKLNSDKSKVYSTDSVGRVYSLVTSTNIETTLSDTGTPLDKAASMVLNSSQTVAYLSGEISPNPGIFSVNLATGTVTTIANNAQGTGPAIIYPSKIIISSDESKLFLIETTTDHILEIDIATGNRSVVSSSSVGTGTNISIANCILLDKGNQNLYTWEQNGLLSIDLATGNRTLLPIPNLSTYSDVAYSCTYEPDSETITLAGKNSFYSYNITNNRFKQLYQGFVGIGKMIPIDIDNDGDMDLVGPDSPNYRYIILENTGVIK